MRVLLALLLFGQCCFAQSVFDTLLAIPPPVHAVDDSPILTNSMLAYWSFDEASGSRLDTAGTNTLTAVNTPGTTNGVSVATSNAVFCVKGANSKLSGVNSINLRSRTNWAINIWHKSLNNDANTYLAAWGDINPAAKEMWVLYPVGATNLALRFASIGGTLFGFTNVAYSEFGLTNWNMTTIQHTGTNMQWYVNGVLAKTYNTTNNINTNWSPGITFGGAYNGGTHSTTETSAFDETFVVGNTNLTTNVLAWIYNSRNGRVKADYR